MLVTLLIIAVTCVVSFAAFGNRRLFDALILWPPAVRRGQYYRLLSYGLIHADGAHLFFNMFTLYFFGAVMAGLYQRLLGPFGFVIFYAGALLASILPAYLRHRDDSRYRSLGASGAVSAVLFAFILVQPWATIVVFVLPVPAIVYAVLYLGYTFYMDRQRSDRINHSAHLWGALYGVAATTLIAPRVLPWFLGQLMQPRFLH